MSDNRKKSRVSPKNSRPRMHHYLPVSYLSRFTDADGFLHVADLKTPKTFKTKPQNVAKIKDFYTGATIDGEESTFLETFFSQVEGNADRVLDKIVATHSLPALDSEEWQWVCLFISFLDRRTPIARLGQQQMGDYLVQMLAKARFGTREAFEVTTVEHAQKTGEKLDFTFEDAQALLKEANITMVIPQNMFLRTLIDSVNTLVPCVLSMTPRLLVATDAQFITGDCALAKYNPNKHWLYGGIGWTMPDLQVYVPISSSHCLWFSRHDESLVMEMDEEDVGGINVQIALWTTQYLLACREDFVWLGGDRCLRRGAEELSEGLAEQKRNFRVFQSWPETAKEPEQN